jgi:hypothetical protein
MANVIDDVLKERAHLLKRLREGSLRVATTSDRDAAQDPQDLLARYVARFQAANQAKQEAIDRWDAEIRHYADLISDLEKDLKSHSHQAETETKSSRTQDAAAKDKTSVARTPRKPGRSTKSTG